MEKKVTSYILDFDDKLKFMKKYPDVDIDAIERKRIEIFQATGQALDRETVYARMLLEQRKTTNETAQQTKSIQKAMNANADVAKSTTAPSRKPVDVSKLSDEQLEEFLKGKTF